MAQKGCDYFSGFFNWRWNRDRERVEVYIREDGVERWDDSDIFQDFYKYRFDYNWVSKEICLAKGRSSLLNAKDWMLKMEYITKEQIKEILSK